MRPKRSTAPGVVCTFISRSNWDAVCTHVSADKGPRRRLELQCRMLLAGTAHPDHRTVAVNFLAQCFNPVSSSANLPSMPPRSSKRYSNVISRHRAMTRSLSLRGSWRWWTLVLRFVRHRGSNLSLIFCSIKSPPNVFRLQGSDR